ncbi:MAG: YciI family protein [Bacteroidota bacterium]
MFIIELTYKVELKRVDEYLEEHVNYLKEQYENDMFIASGRKVPRTGGVILSKTDDRKKLLEILEKDPFKINDLANYNITEFIPSMTSKMFENLKE